MRQWRSFAKRGKGMAWDANNTLGPSKLKVTHIMAYYGSSTYDSKQMSQLIDLLVTDCKEQGIETATPEEIERMKQQYERSNYKNVNNN